MITPQALKRFVDTHPSRYYLMRLLIDRWQPAITTDDPIPFAAWGSVDCDWVHPQHGKLFDAAICVSYDAAADRFDARCWARTARYLFDPQSNQLIRGADGVALNQLLQRYSSHLADGYAVIQFANNKTTIHR